MESFFFHPKMVHLPIALGVIMPLVAGGLCVAWWRAWLPPRAWVIAIALQALLVGSGGVAMDSGGDQEERVEHVVPESAIHEHEEAAETFVYGAAAVLVIMLAAALVPAENARFPLAVASVLGTLVVFVLGYRTGEAGGHLVYQYGAAEVYVQDAAAHGLGSAPGRSASEDADDDD